MIAPQELRIGNLIQWEDESNEIISVDGIYKSKDCWFVKFKEGGAMLDEFIPVEISEDHLLMLGFKKEEGEDVWNNCKLSDFEVIYWISGMYFYDPEDECLYVATDEDTYHMLKKVEFIHEIQNIYFALENEELTIKQ